MKRNVYNIVSVIAVTGLCSLLQGGVFPQNKDGPAHQEIWRSFKDFPSFLREPISIIAEQRASHTLTYHVKREAGGQVSIAYLYRGRERQLKVKGDWLYGSMIQDNIGYHWLYLIPTGGIGPIYFFLVGLDSCQVKELDLFHWQDEQCVRAIRLAPRAGFLSPRWGSLNALCVYDGKAFRIERTQGRLWIWCIDSSRHVVVSWGALSQLSGKRRIETWKGLWLNPNLEPIGDPFPSKVPYVEKVLSTLKEEPPTEEDFQRFRALPHGPEKWALGVRLALYGGGKAGEILVDAVQQQRPITEQFQLYEEKRAEYEVRHAFRKMLIELVGLTADRSEPARRFLVQRLDQKTWESERWIPWRRGVGLTLFAIGLSGRDDLWKEVLAKRQWIDNGGKEALRYGYRVGHTMVWAAFYHWVIQQVGKERFVREVWFQRPTAEWWERWEKTPQGQDWIQWYARIWNQGLKVILK